MVIDIAILISSPAVLVFYFLLSPENTKWTDTGFQKGEGVKVTVKY